MWVGTEDGLALIDKPTGKVVKTWQEKDGLPFKVVTAIDVDQKTGDVWLGLFGGGLARLSGGRFDHWHQLNSGLVNDVVYGVAVENDNVWAATTAGASRAQHGHRRVDGLHREERADGGDLELRRELRRQGQGLPRGLGQRRPRVQHQDRPLEGLPRSRRRDGDRPLPRRRDQPRDRHRGEPGRGRRCGSPPTSAARATTAATGAATRSRRAACPPTSTTTSRAAARRRPSSARTRASGSSPTPPTRTRPGSPTRATPRRAAAGRRSRSAARSWRTSTCRVGVPHSFMISADVDGNDIWVGTSKGLGWGIGDGYYPGTKERPLYAYGQPRRPEARERRRVARSASGRRNGGR